MLSVFLYGRFLLTSKLFLQKFMTFQSRLHCGSATFTIVNWTIATQCLSYKWTNGLGSVCAVVFFVRHFKIGRHIYCTSISLSRIIHIVQELSGSSGLAHGLYIGFILLFFICFCLFTMIIIYLCLLYFCSVRHLSECRNYKYAIVV